LFAPVRLGDADDNVVAVLLPGAGLLQHLVGFADAGRGADENLEPAGSVLFAPGRLEQGLRRGPLVRVAVLLRHQDSNSPPSKASSRYRAAAPSSAKLSANTFTRGSPRRPRMRPSTCWSTSWRTRSSGMLRAFATRGTWKSAAAGEICGSSPPPEVVTRSMGTAAEGVSCLSLSTSPCTRSISALLVGPRFEPPELAAL